MKSHLTLGLALCSILLFQQATPALAGDESAPSTWDQYRKGAKSFNDTEKQLWSDLYAPQKLCMKRARDEAFRASGQGKYSGTTMNGAGDAVRHCTWSCEMTRCLGEDKAKLWGDAHELNPSPDDERQMDLSNNDQGRKTWPTVYDRKDAPEDYSYNGKCASACETAAAAGTLKVLPKDKWR